MRPGYQFLLLVLVSSQVFAQAPLTLPATPSEESVAPESTPEATPLPPVAGTPTPAMATPPTQLSQSIFLDVKDLGANLSNSHNWVNAWGYYSKNTTRARALEINLRNPAKVPGEYLVNWYFFAVPLRGGQRFLFDKDSKSITIPPGGIEKATVVSDELQSRSVRYGYYYYQSSVYKTGTRPEGWIVTVSIGGKVGRVKTSGAQLDALYKNTREFEAMQKPGKSDSTSD